MANWIKKKATVEVDSDSMIRLNNCNMGYSSGGTHWKHLICMGTGNAGALSAEVIDSCGQWIPHPTSPGPHAPGASVFIVDWPWDEIRFTGGVAGDVVHVESRPPAFGG